ncbi:SDR family NAD(P)-dependent oxidoreductase [Listeria seeligeri]|uniref:SDR family NAD(P)-dependent oxidoreductase n=1 Tax=Listeria seeligeri TaxID=1640 RepID=UPI0001C4E320|nr:glucose 1-dehydrogenase [Listeria seeligeri]CBH27290.1 short chain dehydrogenase/reductase family [Listeria seeligeri serovar 1/2b str. SLCC3954]
MNSLEGKVVIVTGAGAGIGKASAVEFGLKKCKVIIVDNDKESGEVSKKLIEDSGGEATFINADITVEKDIKNMVEKVLGKYARIDILVNNVGLFNNSGMDATVEEWNEVVRANIISPFLCTKYCLPTMKENRAGAVVNVASISGFIAQENYLLYNTTKGAMINMTRCMALDLGKYNIRVNNVCPGTVWTENNEYFIKKSHNIDKRGADLHSDFGGGNMLSRVSEPKEIAKCIVFLASEDASFVTAENLVVDAGYIAK